MWRVVVWTHDGASTLHDGTKVMQSDVLVPDRYQALQNDNVCFTSASNVHYSQTTGPFLLPFSFLVQLLTRGHPNLA
jgi:hypothetical protein